MQRRLPKLAASLAAFAALIVTFGVAGAQAYSVSSTGSPGSIGVPQTQGWTDLSHRRIVSFPARWVHRSPAYSGSQAVRVYMRVWRFNRSYRRWEFLRQGIVSDVLARREVMRTDRYSPAFTGLLEDTYATDLVVVWRRASGGAVIGRQVVDHNGTGDFACYSSNCSVFYSPDAGSAGLFFS